MKELNELVEMAKEISSKRWFLNSDEEVTAFDNDAGADDSEEAFIGCAANIQLAKYIAAASPETVLAISEAFLALEQRAEAAEAKLAEHEKQEPVIEAIVDGRATDDYLFNINKPLPNGIHELFTRPVPAVSLAEMVPRVIPKAVYEVIYQECGGFVESNANAQTIWTVCRAAILRNIEEAK